MSHQFDQEASIAVIGMAGRFPGANDLESYWQNLIDGVCSIAFLSEEELRAEGIREAQFQHPDYVPAMGLVEDLDLFDPAFFGISPREAEIMDPQHRMLLTLAWEAFENAGYHPKTYHGSVGTFAGAMANTYLRHNLLPNSEKLKHVMRRQMVMNNDREFLATFINFKLDLKGPAVNVQTACSTSLVAVHYACQALLYGECEMALAGGVALTVPAKKGYLYREGLIQSPDGYCRTFDARAQGTVFGRGGGMVLLKRYADALEDKDVVQAIIRGSAINNDGSRKMSFSAPSVDGQAEAIAAAMAIGEVNPRDVTYVEAHGTGTILGDPVEVASLTKAFGQQPRQQPCALGSVKTNIGHLDAAAGIAGLIKTVLALKHKTLPPSLNYQNPNPKIDFHNSPFEVVKQSTPWNASGPRLAGINSFGVGGTNAHAVLQEAPEHISHANNDTTHLLTLSTDHPELLASSCLRLSHWMEQHTQANMGDVAFTLANGREHRAHRLAIVAKTPTQAAKQLHKLSQHDHTRNPIGKSTSPRLLFLLPGQGSQYMQMGNALYEKLATFRTSLDTSHQHLSQHGIDLIQMIHGARTPNSVQTLQQTQNAQVAIFAVSLAMAHQLEAWGIRPNALLGHSLGELAAATLAGVFAVSDALDIVVKRGRLMQEMPKGAMVSVSLGAKDMDPFLDEHTWLAAENSERRITVSGTFEGIEALKSRLKEKGVQHRLLNTSHAFHSPMMQKAARQFQDFLTTVAMHPPQIPYFTNLSGNLVSAEEATSPKHWAQALFSPVLFAPSLRQLEDDWIGLEVGPGKGLTTLAKEAGLDACETLAQTRDHKNEWHVLQDSLGFLYTHGFSNHIKALYEPRPYRRVALPTTPWHNQSYWVSPEKKKTEPNPKPSLERYSSTEEWLYTPLWEPGRISMRVPDYQQHWMIFSPINEHGDVLAQCLGGQLPHVTWVQPGQSFAQINEQRFSLPPEDPQAYGLLLESLKAKGRLPNVVLHGWDLNQDLSNSSATTHSQRNTALAYRFYPLFHLCKQWNPCSNDAPLMLMILGHQSMQLTDDPSPHPLRAVTHGAVRVIDGEFPNIRCRHIDLPLEGPSPTLAQQLMREPYLEDAFHVAYRNGKRWKLSYHKEPMDTNTQLQRLRKGGRYLITGGLGGINFKVAQFLAQKTQGTLFLTTRSTVPTPSSAETHPFHAEVLKSVKEMEENGAKVFIVQADACDKQAMSALLHTIEIEHGPLHGVVNGAGVKDGAMIYNQSKEGIETVFAPKLHGSLILTDLLKNTALDFMVHFSTLHTVVGGVGKLAHACASSLLDALPLAAPNYQVAINWDAWSEVGQAAKTEEPWEITKPQHPIFVRKQSRGTETRFTVALDARKDWYLNEHHVGGKAVLPGTAFLCMAHEAMTDLGNHAPVLKDVVIVQPLALPEDGTAELHLCFEGNTQTGAFRADCHWQGITTTHVTATYATGDDTHPTIDLDTLESGLPAPKSRRKKASSDTYFHHGPRWRSMQWSRINGKRGLAQLEQQFPEDRFQFAIHPAVLDTAIGYLAKANFKGAYLPFAFDRVSFYGPMPTQSLAYAQLQSETKNKKTLVQDIQVSDERGNLCAEIQGFALREVQPESPGNPQSFQLRLQDWGQQNLYFEKQAIPKPAEGEVLIKVEATGLNFKDILRVGGMMGHQPEETKLGMECSGIVSAVGDGVTSFKEGDRVIAFAAHTFRGHLAVSEKRIFACPDKLDLVQAATIPVAFLTAYHALVVVGRLSPGEKVLIHCASGGVGLAAVQIAKHLGAEIFATAGNEKKTNYLRQLGIEHVFDSRSASFYDGVMTATKNGVDVVLNSLSGPLAQKGLEALAPFGRFLELGRRDIMAETQLNMGIFKKNLGFSAITASANMPGFNQSFRKVLENIEKGVYTPLPERTFEIHNVAEAFRVMAEAKHIGKLVITTKGFDKIPWGKPKPVKRKRNQTGHGMSNEEGLEVFSKILGANHRRVVVSTRELSDVAAIQANRMHKKNQEKAQVDATPNQRNLPQFLRDVWSEFLGVSQPDPDVSFFDMGGDSISAIQIISHLNKTLDIRLSSYALMDTPTINQLQIAIQQNMLGHTKDDQLIRFAPEKSNLPQLFLLPPVEGEVFAYRNLAKYFEGTWEVTALREPGLTGNAPLPETLTEAAQRYATLVRQYKTSDQLALGGHSYGGLLALETSRLLKAEGIEVAEVKMWDTFAPEQWTFHFEDDASVMAFLSCAQEPMSSLLPKLRSMGTAQQLSWFQENRGQDLETDEITKLIQRFRHHSQLMQQHDLCPYEGPVHLYVAETPLEGFPHGGEAWAPYCQCLTMETVPGNHLTLIHPDNLQPMI